MRGCRIKAHLASLKIPNLIGSSPIKPFQESGTRSTEKTRIGVYQLKCLPLLKTMVDSATMSYTISTMTRAALQTPNYWNNLERHYISPIAC